MLGQDHGPGHRITELTDLGLGELYLRPVERDGRDIRVGFRCHGRRALATRKHGNCSSHARCYGTTAKVTSIHY